MFTQDEIAVAKYHAACAVEHASAAFWMLNRSEGTAEFLCRQTLEDLTKAAAVLGYRIEKIEAPVEAQTEAA